MVRVEIMEEHKRRPHYSGKYPKKFNEKYKELDPERYSETVEHVKEKGITPAGMHVPICVGEIMDFLQIRPAQKGMDCTLGYGGHTEEMLKRLSGSGHITGLDADPIESEKTVKRLRAAGYGEDIFTCRHINFRDIDRVAEEEGRFDFVLADLGVSSMQIDDPKRGFSMREDGPLDLRLDPTCGKSAAERLKEMTADEIEGMLIENSDEPYAAEIAKAIAGQEWKTGIHTTGELKNVVTAAVEPLLAGMKKEEIKENLKKTCQRTFQAVRIDVNSEFEVLEELMEKLPGVLNPGGRAAILTFHSGEDRIVKKMMKEHYNRGLYSEISKEVIRPSDEECRRNPRARSAKLRTAVRA